MERCAHNSSKALPRSRKDASRFSLRRRLQYELLERRTMLSGTPNVEFQDLGDFYMAGEERIPLLRAVNELVVTLKADVIPSTSVGSIVVTEAALADFQPTERVYGRHSTIRIDSKSSGLSANMMNAKQSLAAHSEVAWAGEVFVSARTGRWIIPNNEVIVSLDNGIVPEDVFGAAFESFRHLRGSTNQYIGTLTAGGGLATLETSAEIVKLPGVVWASPNLFQIWTRASVPNDPLFDDEDFSQWNLLNTGQHGAKSGADANLPDAWDITTGNNNIVIAVIDDGVQFERGEAFAGHPDLDGDDGDDYLSGGDGNDQQLERRKCPTIDSKDCRRVYALAI